MRRPALVLFCALGLVPILAVPGRAQIPIQSREGIALQNQILQLQQQVQSLAARGGAAPQDYYQAPPAGAGQAAGSLVPQLLERVSRLEDDMRDLRGRVDELQNALQQQNADLTKQIADLKFQLQNGAETPAANAPPPGGALGTMPQGAAQAPATSPSTRPRRKPELAMQEGDAALARRDYAAAEAAAREVLQNFPRSPRAYDAQFLLAQALSGQRNYQAAAIAYDDAFNRGQRSSRAADSLLGLAESLVALNDRPAACGALDKLRQSFPATRTDARANATRARAGCR